MLHFFATFSKTSMKQLPQIQNLHEKYGEKGLVVIGLTVEQDSGKLREFASQNKLSYPILLGARKALKDYRLGQLPDVCFINRQSVISSIYTGFSPDVEEKIEVEGKKLLMITRARE